MAIRDLISGAASNFASGSVVPQEGSPEYWQQKFEKYGNLGSKIYGMVTGMAPKVPVYGTGTIYTRPQSSPSSSASSEVSEATKAYQKMLALQQKALEEERARMAAENARRAQLAGVLDSLRKYDLDAAEKAALQRFRYTGRLGQRYANEMLQSAAETASKAGASAAAARGMARSGMTPSAQREAQLQAGAVRAQMERQWMTDAEAKARQYRGDLMAELGRQAGLATASSEVGTPMESQPYLQALGQYSDVNLRKYLGDIQAQGERDQLAMLQQQMYLQSLYNQQAQEKEKDSGGGFWDTVLGIGGGILGSVVGPAGTAVGLMGGEQLADKLFS